MAMKAMVLCLLLTMQLTYRSEQMMPKQVRAQSKAPILEIHSVESMYLGNDNIRFYSWEVTPFDSVDKDKNGLIDFYEFEKWYKTELGVMDDIKIRSTYSKFDTSHDQSLDVSEFVPLAFELSQKPIDTSEQIFRVLHNFIRNDLKNYMRDKISNFNAIYIISWKKNNSKQLVNFKYVGYMWLNIFRIIDGVLSIADTNMDGQLTFQEFAAQLNYSKPKSQVRQQLTKL
uniref:EF-hand domain-containing protein n=1 Tax=Heterorhabditis bacteriophora TaxID=37862 RepID=A0A1I7XL74_HETBA